MTKLSRLRVSTLLKIPGVGRKYADSIVAWQSHASFSHEVEWVGEMIIEDARRILALKNDIKALELRCRMLMQESQAARLIRQYSRVCCDLCIRVGRRDWHHRPVC
ncbi:hypothetical protein [Nitrosomonas sp.]|uniref:hypothetical protein n=1 Tax=Nitrosomonas sp. TaxID=42353 RepID=UPI0025F26C74|nr:hypothetical protein [Nitrosomonas sp.]